jgi:leucyl aminopeptidase
MTRPTVVTARSLPRVADAIGVPVATDGPVPRALGLNRAALAAHGFEGKAGQVLGIPGSGPIVIAVGIGATRDLTPKVLRDTAAALTRAAGRHEHLATTLVDVAVSAGVRGLDARAAAQAVVEGVLLAGYRYGRLKSDLGNASRLDRLTLVSQSSTASAGAARGEVISDAVIRARDWANTPPHYLTARVFADEAATLAAETGLEVEIFNRDQLEAMGCGGIVGVNQGSVEPPRMVRLRWTPRNPSGHVVLVGKGVMYDSGGISLKPSDASHVMMKMDMSGAAAVLATMSTLRDLKCKTAVTAYLMCTDNLPSGSAMKLGDVLRFRNGKTAEIHNTDAEGRLILADGLSLASEEKPDAIIDIATLTGAAQAALGQKIAALLGNDQSLIDSIRESSTRVDEPVWQLPLAREYRPLLDSNIADMKNIGGPYGGAITAALFLAEFVDDVPWAHLDIAGVMSVEADDAWKSRGATAFGTRLLIDVVNRFSR